MRDGGRGTTLRQRLENQEFQDVFLFARPLRLLHLAYILEVERPTCQASSTSHQTSVDPSCLFASQSMGFTGPERRSEVKMNTTGREARGYKSSDPHDSFPPAYQSQSKTSRVVGESEPQTQICDWSPVNHQTTQRDSAFGCHYPTLYHGLEAGVHQGATVLTGARSVGGVRGWRVTLGLN